MVFEYGKPHDGLHFYINRNKIHVRINLNDKTISFIVIKSINGMVGNYLDILLDSFDNNYQNYGGLIGFIGNQEISIKESVQLNGKAVLKFNEKYVVVEEKQRSREKCWLISNLEKLLKPQIMKNFIY